MTLGILGRKNTWQMRNMVAFSGLERLVLGRSEVFFLPSVYSKMCRSILGSCFHQTHYYGYQTPSDANDNYIME